LARPDDHRAPVHDEWSNVGTYAISGSASGIGAATRAKLENAGNSVIGIDLRDAEVIADLSTPDGRQHAIDTTLELCSGTLDGLVTAAGVGPPLRGNLIARVNYFGSHALLQGLRPALAAAGAAQVVQVGSNSTTTTPNLPDELIAAFLGGDEPGAVAIVEGVPEPFDGAIAYGGAKLAISRWCRRAAVTAEWVGEGITLNVIAPGPVQTPLFQQGKDDADFGPLMENFPIPTGEPATPDLMADWIIFMLSPAARFACGSVIFVDGGADAIVRSDAWPASFSM
jgi:NAD(P)-dependent dehydrogenase (short-subunit alcohol dehydrogenase family)